jgi:hypothetical protein
VSIRLATITKQDNKNRRVHYCLPQSDIKFTSRDISVATVSFLGRPVWLGTQQSATYFSVSWRKRYSSHKERRIWDVPLETLQDTKELCSKEITLPRLLLNEHKSLVNGVDVS